MTAPDRHALTRRAVAAASAVAVRHGLAPSGHELLSDRGNAVLRLLPYPLVARVATLGAQTREAGGWMRREVESARLAAAHGAEVVGPSELVEPGPHVHDGLWVSFWPWVEHRRRLPGAEAVGRTLGALHRAVAGVALSDRAPLGPVHELVAGCLDVLRRDAPSTGRLVDPALVDRLTAEHASAQAAVAALGEPLVVVHGDAHPGNLLRTPVGWVWSDLEEMCRAPVAWDLAVVTGGADRVDTASATLTAWARRSAPTRRTRPGWPRSAGSGCCRPPSGRRSWRARTPSGTPPSRPG